MLLFGTGACRLQFVAYPAENPRLPEIVNLDQGDTYAAIIVGAVVPFRRNSEMMSGRTGTPCGETSPPSRAELEIKALRKRAAATSEIFSSYPLLRKLNP